MAKLKGSQGTRAVTTTCAQSGNRQYIPKKAPLGAGMLRWVQEGTLGLEMPCLSVAGWGRVTQPLNINNINILVS